MKSSGKKSTVASFVEGKKASKAPKPKSLTPKVKSSGDKKRMGKYGKELAY